jgi:glycosyltransferase involved in cell wall biosynthesis
MNNNISFSIIIPTYNRGHVIASTIKSALNQDYKNFEIIVVDDGSSDGTEKIVNSINHPSLTYYKKDNAERGAARNFGIDKAKGDYLTFLDSDDILYPDFLKNAQELILKYHPPFFHLAYEIKNEHNKVIHKMNYIRSDSIDFIKRGNYLSCIGVFMRKDIAHDFRFNEDVRLSGSEDWELWIRLIAHFGIKTDTRISASLIQHDERSVNKSDEARLLDRKNLSLDYAFRDKVVREKFGPSLRKIESHMLSYIAIHLAISGNKSRALFYITKAFLRNPLVVIERRFGAIMKHLVFGPLAKKNERVELN